MKAFRRRISRDRTSKSYTDNPTPNRPYSEDVDNSSPHQPYKDSQYASDYNSQDKLQNSRPVTAGEPQYSQADMQPNDHHNPTTYNDESQFRGRSIEPAPDSLTKAFNDAIRPLHQQIADLKAALDDYAGRCESLEAREGDMCAWIDKRGFRADVPPSIAAVMNAEPAAAATLNYQLDRRMTVVNHDLHRLQDNVSNDLPTTTFSEALGAMIPSIRDLAHLPHGSPFAFELLIKLGGNLNSHGGDQSWSNELDQQSRGAFYNKLDDVMVEIVKLRLEDSDPADGPGPTGRHGISQTDAGAHGGHGQGEMWHIGRDIKRLEQTGKFLKTKLGLEQYFPRSLMEMRGGEMQKMGELPMQGRA